jgi:hypothetical protein
VPGRLERKVIDFGFLTYHPALLAGQALNIIQTNCSIGLQSPKNTEEFSPGTDTPALL